MKQSTAREVLFLLLGLMGVTAVAWMLLSRPVDPLPSTPDLLQGRTASLEVLLRRARNPP